MRVPPDMLTANLGGLVTAVTELPGPKLVMLLDVEKVLSETTRYDDEFLFKGIEPIEAESPVTVYFADDSSVARKQIERTWTCWACAMLERSMAVQPGMNWRSWLLTPPPRVARSRIWWRWC
jgi:hypothetical protein